MYEIKCDKKKNRLYIKVGKLEKGEAKKAVNEVVSQLPDLKKGFTCIFDVSELFITSIDALAELERCQIALAKAGLKQSVRLIGDELVPKPLEGSKKDYAVVLAKTLEEAEMILGG